MVSSERVMKCFDVRDLRERCGDLVRNAEQGSLAIVAEHGRPLFVVVPLDDDLRAGVGAALAIRLFEVGALSLGKAAELAGLSYEAFVEQLGALSIPAVGHPPDELDTEARASG
jgi:prevent-host-death family protein